MHNELILELKRYQAQLLTDLIAALFFCVDNDDDDEYKRHKCWSRSRRNRKMLVTNDIVVKKKKYKNSWQLKRAYAADRGTGVSARV